MPCNTIQQSKVEFLAKNTDTGLLTQALERLGFEVSKQDDRLVLGGRDTYGYYGSGSYDSKTGRLELSNGWDINEIKRGYSEQIIENQARKFGWQLQWSTNKVGHREATVLRRG
jgi:hypothetical protein